MPKKRLFSIILLMTASGGVVAQEPAYEKNGLPCIFEVCIGDSISSLANIKWDRAKGMFSTPQEPDYISDRKISDNERKSISSKFHGDTTNASKYLLSRQFDSDSLPYLEQINYTCDQHGDLIGTFTTSSGHLTRVGINIIPDEHDATKQRWVVTTIDRIFLNAITSEQKSDIKSQLMARYKICDLKNYNQKSRAFCRVATDNLSYNGAVSLYLALSGTAVQNISDRIKMNPKCGGSSKIKID